VAPPATVGIVGLRALRRDIKAQTDETSSALFAAMKQAGRRAAEPVAAATVSNLPRVSGRLSSDVRITATRTGAAVRMGRKPLPYAGWVEFGGRRKRPHDSQRPFVKSGRYLFPAAREYSYRVAELYSQAVQKVLSSSGIWTNTSDSVEAVHD
jgi:hypothetical protein